MIVLDGKLKLGYASGRFLCPEYGQYIPGLPSLKWG